MVRAALVALPPTTSPPSRAADRGYGRFRAAVAQTVLINGSGFPRCRAGRPVGYRLSNPVTYGLVATIGADVLAELRGQARPSPE